VNRGILVEHDAYPLDSDNRMPDLGFRVASVSARTTLTAVGVILDKATYKIRVRHEEATS